MHTLLLALLCFAALAYDVGDWPRAELEAQVARVAGEGAEVIEAQGVPLIHAGPIQGVILGRFKQGSYTYGHVQTVYTKGGQTWISPGWGVGGCESAAVLGVLDLAGEGSLALAEGWAGSAVQEPAEKPKKPALAVLSRLRYDNGRVRTELLLLDLADLERPFQVLRVDAGTQLPIWDPRAGMPVQRSLGTQALTLAVVQGEHGPELRLTERDLPTPDSRCLEPEPELRRFLFQDGRFVEQHPRPYHEGCP